MEREVFTIAHDLTKNTNLPTVSTHICFQTISFPYVLDRFFQPNLSKFQPKVGMQAWNV